MADEKKRRTYCLIDGPDGVPIAVPADELDEPKPTPSDDGKYYLSEGRRAEELALELAERGVEVYCARCRAPLKVTRRFILCTRDENHFRVTFHLRD